MDVSFKGLRALVTGAGQGIGRDVCKALVKCGAEVTALSRTKLHLDTLKKECPTIKTISVDLSDWDATVAAAKEAGDIDLLVNNAGTTSVKWFGEYTSEDVDRVLNTNVKGVIAVSQVIAMNMKSRGKGGAIVNVSSQASLFALNQHAVYGPSKAAVDNLTKNMALELGPHKIRVNCVNPTVVWTAMARTAWTDPVKQNTMLSRIPLRKFAEIEDVVHTILYLLSDKAAMLNGVILPIDGGASSC